MIHHLPAQSFLASARHIGMESGLPNRAVGYIIEDSRGFSWISTFDGMALYDGQRFKIFTKSENGLGSDAVHWLLEDAAGKIWLIHIDTL